MHIEVIAFIWTAIATSIMNMAVGSTIYDMAAQQHTAAYDRLYAVKEHDLAAYEEIVQQYKEAQVQAQGQALYNQQKLTNLALMLETEYLSRQNQLVGEINRKLNYRVAIEAALAEQESKLGIESSILELKKRKKLDPFFSAHDQLDRKRSRPGALCFGPGRADPSLCRSAQITVDFLQNLFIEWKII